MEIGSPFYGRVDGIRRRPRREQLVEVDALKKELHALDEQATDLIEELGHLLLEKSTTSADELLAHIESKQDLHPRVRAEAFTIVDKYRNQHDQVEKILMEHPNPKELFTSCFGFAPTGEIQMVRSSITINFIVFNARDYERAFSHLEEPGTPDHDQSQEKARNSGGCALPKTLLSESEGIFTLTKVGSFTERKRTSDIETAERTLQPREKLSAPGLTSFEARFGRKSANIMYNWRSPTTLVQGAHVIHADPSLETQIDDETTDYSLAIDDLVIRIRHSEGGEVMVKTDTVSGYSCFKNEGTEPVSISYSQYREELVIGNPDQIRKTIAHEVQHQWNRLFLPKDVAPSMPKIATEKIIGESTVSSKETAKDVIRYYFERTRRDTSLGHSHRRAETRGRDEILAYYRDGSSTERIEEALHKDLYNYFANRDHEKLRTDTKEMIRRYNIQKEDIRPEFERVSFTIEEIDELIAEQQTRYFEMIRAGCAAIRILEKCGVPRSRIVAKLYKANLIEWHAIARRFKLHQATVN